MRCLGEVTGTEIRGPHRLQRNSSQQKQQSWVLWTFSRFFSTEQPGSEEGRGALQSRWADSRAFHQDRRPPGRGPIQVTWCLRAGFAVLASPGPALSWKLICHGSSGRYPHPSSAFQQGQNPSHRCGTFTAETDLLVQAERLIRNTACLPKFTRPELWYTVFWLFSRFVPSRASL